MDHSFNLDDVIQQLQKGNQNSKKGGTQENPSSLSVELRDQLFSLCKSKAEEFALLGYDKIKAGEIWNYFENKYRQNYPPLHRMVNEILGLKITQYMNWATLNAYKGI